MRKSIDTSFLEKHGKPEEYYANIVSKKLRDTLSSPEIKEERASQIDYLEKEVLANKAIRIRVRPRFIKFFSKLTGVHDYKGGAYWGNTIYLGHTSDLFNSQIVQHEGIHVLQQQELGGFFRWLVEVVKEANKYKKENKDLNGSYDLSTKIATEMEAYVNQLIPGYIKDREEKSFRNYSKPEGLRKGIQRIEESNYQLDKKELDKKLIQNKFDGNDPEILNTQHDIEKLDTVKKLSDETENPDIRVFNYIDKIKDISCVMKILDKKLKILENKGKQSSKSNNKLKKLIKQYYNEIANENVSYMLEDEFVDADVIKQAIKILEQKCHEYRKSPTCIRLEEKGKHDNLYKNDDSLKDSKKHKGVYISVPQIYPNLENY